QFSSSRLRETLNNIISMEFISSIDFILSLFTSASRAASKCVCNELSCSVIAVGFLSPPSGVRLTSSIPLLLA
ncbi:MAG TPA: hypothetical protein VHH33_00860, partial [Nitrososphaeraceae archaeon]|nr:hypothetical protein [Nitrososphaeraceae archaeon]